MGWIRLDLGNKEAEQVPNVYNKVRQPSTKDNPGLVHRCTIGHGEQHLMHLVNRNESEAPTMSDWLPNRLGRSIVDTGSGIIIIPDEIWMARLIWWCFVVI